MSDNILDKEFIRDLMNLFRHKGFSGEQVLELRFKWADKNKNIDMILRNGCRGNDRIGYMRRYVVLPITPPDWNGEPIYRYPTPKRR